MSFEAYSLLFPHNLGLMMFLRHVWDSLGSKPVSVYCWAASFEKRCLIHSTVSEIVAPVGIHLSHCGIEILFSHMDLCFYVLTHASW